MRILLAVLAALVGMSCMGLTVFLVEEMGRTMFPPSAEMLAALDKLMAGDPSGREAFEAALPTMPFGAFASIVLAWVLGAVVGPGSACITYGAFTKSLTAPTCRRFGIGFAVLNALACIANVVSFPSPAWMVAVGTVLPPVASLLVGFRMAANRPAA